MWIEIIAALVAVLAFFATIGGFIRIIPYIPFAVEALSNDPNRNRPEGELHRNYEPSRFGFFTRLQPGQVKIIERGNRFVRCIMDYDGHQFAGERPGEVIDHGKERYWEVANTAPGGTDSKPVVEPEDDAPFWEQVFYRWRKRIYDVTGYVFTGIYPFQSVRVYPMDRYALSYDDQGNIITTMKQDFSDHYRVEDFQFPVTVSKADTKDKVPVRVVQNFIGRVANPYEAAYATDDAWSARLLSIISNAVTEWSRTTPLDNVLSAESKKESSQLRRAVLKIEIKPKKGQTEEDVTVGVRAFGMKAIDTYILDISSSDPSYDQKLGDLAIARIDRDAAIERAKGSAAEVDEVAKAAAKHGRVGELTLRVQGRINTAKAAGDSAIVMLGDDLSRTDSLLASQLKEQRKR